MNSSLPKTSLVIPIEKNNFSFFPSLKSLLSQMSLLRKDFEVILVNQGLEEEKLDTQSPLNFLNGQAEKIKIVNHPKNQEGSSFLFGFRKTQGDPIIFADYASGSLGMKIRLSLAYFEQEKADVLTLRTKIADRERLFDKIFSSFYARMADFLFKIPFSGTLPAILIVKREILEKIPPLSSKILWQLNLLVEAKDLGVKKIIEVPKILEDASPNQAIKPKSEILSETFGIFGQRVLRKAKGSVFKSSSEDDSAQVLAKMGL